MNWYEICLSSPINHFSIINHHIFLCHSNKSLQGGSGYVKNIRFANVKVSEVKTPIIIDQFYCDYSRCKNQSSAVALSEITYEGIKGTYTVQPVYLACSDIKPCLNIHLNDIELELLNEHEHVYEPFCWQAYGELQGPTEPPINCLQSVKPKINQIHPDHGSNWLNLIPGYIRIDVWLFWFFHPLHNIA